MRAYVVESRGRRGAQREIPSRELRTREIRVRVAVAGVNPVDWKLRDLYDRPTPFTLGQDFAGVVAQVGVDVDAFAPGDRVFGVSRAGGAYAQETIVDLDDASSPVGALPAAVDDAAAAGLPTPGLTALACLDALPTPRAGTLLIVGVTGALGRLLAQLARDAGFDVAGVGRSPQPELAAELGLRFYDVDADDALERLRARAPHGFAAVVDAVHAKDAIAPFGALVADGGSLVSVNRSVDDALAATSRYRALNVNRDGAPRSNRDGLAALAKAAASGTLRAGVVGERPFDAALDALDAVKAGRVSGKLVVRVAPSASADPSRGAGGAPR